MSFRPYAGPPVQDMPPKGGFPAIDISRRARTRGPTGAQLWAAAFIMGFWGFYRQTQRNAEDVGGDLEERKARMLMAPYLQAEFDREWVTQHRAHLKAEADIMKDVPGWVVGRSVYMGNRWVNRKPLLLDVQHQTHSRG